MAHGLTPMSEDVLRQILGEIGGLKASDAQRVADRQEIFRQLDGIKQTMGTMHGDIRTTKHGLNNLDMAIRGDGGRFDQVDARIKETREHLGKHCIELET